MNQLIELAISKGAKIYSSVSGGKDGQAMVKTLTRYFPQTALVHADLGRVEWPQSMDQCKKLSQWENIPLFVVKRNDGLDLLDYWKRRMNMLQGQNIPFWSSSSSRYCTSDLKRLPINNFFVATKEKFIISAEGIRSEESVARSKKTPLTIRKQVTSSYYEGMTVEQAIQNYRPDKRLVLTWYPIFLANLNYVWWTYNEPIDLLLARDHYKETKQILPDWKFHPAYAMGNDRLSCMFCVLGSKNDLQNAAKHNPELLDELIAMEEYSGFTFKNKFSLKELL